MKRKSPRDIPDFSRKPKGFNPKGHNPDGASAKQAPVQQPKLVNVKPPSMSNKTSGNRGG